MFNEEIRKLLIQVISSWQIIAVTLVLIVYIFIINRVANLKQRRPKKDIIPKVKKAKKAPAHEASDELGLEEEPLAE